MLPYIDFEVIHSHPKIFMGYSDSTTTHMMCYKAGIRSYYGPTLLVDFAENGGMHPYTVEGIKKTLFSSEPAGAIEAAKEWTSEFLPWEEKNKGILRKYQKNQGYELLQGKGVAKGRLIGGCVEVFDMLRGTELFPEPEEFEDTILFLETSEEKPPVWFLECALRIYGINGILDRINGMLFGKPQDEVFYEEYKEIIKKVMKEFGREDLPILYNMDFGHTEPKVCLPIGTMAQIDCDNIAFELIEPAVKG